MQQMLGTLVLVLVLGYPLVNAQGRGHGRPPGNHEGSDRISGAVHITFGRQDVEILRAHYAPQYRSLPPGLRKKLARTGTLPPGWQKKLQPFPVSLDRRLGPLPDGYVRGVFDGHAVIVNPRSGVLIDVAVLF